MFATLPDFTPRDSHTLWYTSSRNPFIPPGSVDHPNADPGSGHHHGSNQSRQRGHLLEQTVLARLAADEALMLRRQANVQNFGGLWLRPPGVPKTLHQMREERREQEEHQEAMRREQLAQELAEAEGGMTDDGMMDDVQLDGAQDLDDEIPDADDDFGLGRDDDDEEDDEEDDDEEEDEEEEEEEYEEGEGEDADETALREERQHDLMAARMRMTDDAFREALIRGDPEGDDMYGGEEELEEQDRCHMLDEDDFGYDGALDGGGGGGGGDMDANLDDDIPEADDGGYEHTDSEAELSSSNRSSSEEAEDDDEEEGEGGQENRSDGDDDNDDDDDDDDDGVQDISFAPRAAPLGPPQSPTLRSRILSVQSRPRASMDLSGLLSQDESSFMESSPAMGRRPRRR